MGLFSLLAKSYRAVMDSTKEVVIRGMMGVLIFLGYVLLSLFVYAIMRRVMVPQKLHVKPVHLYFHPECLAEDVRDCPFPKAEFLLNDGKKLLSSGQHYQISLQLEAPESPVNEVLGVFMINITLYTTDHQFLSTSARPAMVKYKSSLLRTISTIAFSLPLLLGLWHQDQVILVPLYEDYYEPYGDGTLSATVSVLNPRVQLYSATLIIDANFGGFTYYLYQWPVTMTVIVVLSIFVALCTCTLVLWIRDVLRDYDAQRRRRRVTRQQQQQQRGRGGGGAGSGSNPQAPAHNQQQVGGGGGGGGGGVVRRSVVIPRPPHSVSSPSGGLPSYTPRSGGVALDDRATPTPSEVSESTEAEDTTTTSSQVGGHSELSSVTGDTDTEDDGGRGGGGGGGGPAATAGIDDILHTLRTLHQDMKEEEEEEGGRGGGREEQTMRRRQPPSSS